MKTIFLFLAALFSLSLSAVCQNIQSISPTAGNAGEMLSVTISGHETNFEQGTDVISLINGSSVYPVQSVFVNDSLIESTFAFNKDNPTGAYSLSIAKNGGYTLSLNNCFTLNSDPTLALFDSLYPATASQDQILTLTIKGINTHFGSSGVATSVYLKQGTTQIAGTNVVALDSVTVQAQFTFSYAHPIGLYDIYFYNMLDGTVNESSAFTLNAGPAVPVIVSCQPDTGFQGEFLTVSITGQNTIFQQGTDVIKLTNGSTVISPQQNVFVSGTLIQSTFAFNQDYPAGIYNLSVVKNGGYTLSLNNCFTLNSDPSPGSLISILPSSGTQGQTVSLSITGVNTNFGISGTTTTIYLKQGAYQITPSTTTVSNSETLQVQFNLTYGFPSGIYDVYVKNTLDGTMVLAGGFMLNSGSVAPAITSVAPNTGLTGETLTISITGQNTVFQQGTDNVRLIKGGTTITPTSLSFVNTTQLNATFNFYSSHPTGYYNVNITGDHPMILENGFNLSVAIPANSPYITTDTTSDTTTIIISPQIFSYAVYLGSAMTYTAMMGDGNPLPANVRFDSTTLTLTIFNAKDALWESIVITAKDEYLQTASVAIPLGQYLAINDDWSFSNNLLSVYPNPASSIITILSPQKSKIAEEIVVCDASGKILLRATDRFDEIDISALAKGVYFVRVVTYDNKVLTGKFFKE